MAKRFINHGVLRNPWLREAPTLHKLLWIGLFTECDHAGIWIVDWPMMELLVGGKIDRAAAKKFLEGRFIEIDNGRRWFLPDFIKFQYPQGLDTNNNAIKSVRKLLEKQGVDHSFLTLDEGLPKGSLTLPEGLQDKDKDKEREKDLSVRVRDPEIPRLLNTEHRGQKVDWYEAEFSLATDCADKVLKKLKAELDAVPNRYAKRLASYKTLVELMLNGDIGLDGGMHTTVLMLPKQLKFIEYSKLADVSKGPELITKIVTNMHNKYVKNVKGGTSFYITALDWLKREVANGTQPNGIPNTNTVKVSKPSSTNEDYRA